jgi:hypothetical protein
MNLKWADETDLCKKGRISELARMSFLDAKMESLKTLTRAENDEFSGLVDKWMVVLYVKECGGKAGKADLEKFRVWRHSQPGGQCKECGGTVDLCSCCEHYDPHTYMDELEYNCEYDSEVYACGWCKDGEFRDAPCVCNEERERRERE